MKQQLKHTFAGVLSGVMLAASIPYFALDNLSNAADCVVDTAKTYQSIHGFGGINLPEWISEGDMTDAQRKTAFGNGDNELGLTILRIFVNDDKNQWSKAVPTAKAAQSYGATIFASPWNPPSSIRESGGSKGANHVKTSGYAAYATHLNDYHGQKSQHDDDNQKSQKCF